MTFTNRHVREIGDHPQGFEPSGDDDNTVVEHLNVVIPGVEPTPEDDAELPRVDVDFDAKPTGVEVDSDYVPQEHTEIDGLGQQDPEAESIEALSAKPSAKPNTEPIFDTQVASPKKGMAAHNARNRKPPEKYVPSMTGNKYAVALTQIVALLKAASMPPKLRAPRKPTLGNYVVGT